MRYSKFVSGEGHIKWFLKVITFEKWKSEYSREWILYVLQHRQLELCKSKDEKENEIMYLCRRIIVWILIKKGIYYEKIIADKYNPRYNCWLFKNTPELKNAVEEYYAQIK